MVKGSGGLIYYVCRDLFYSEYQGEEHLMKAILVKEIGRFEYVDVSDPEPGPDEVLIKVDLAGLCRTDLKIIEVGHHDLVLPRIPAEEVVGTVCGIGQKAYAGMIGKRVYVYPGTSCGECRFCRSGAGNLCGSMQIMGFHRDGGFAEYVTAPVRSLIEIPDGLEFEQAVFAEPLSCCLNAIELARLKANETIVIYGAGPAGTLLSRAASTIGAKPTVVEPDERRRGLVNGCAKIPDQLFDVAIIAVGSHDAYLDAIQHLEPRGRMVVFSGLAPDVACQRIDLNRLHYLEQTITGAYGCTYRHSVRAIEWIDQGRVEVRDMISHRFPLKQLSHALDLVKKRLGMKILLYPRIVE